MEKYRISVCFIKDGKHFREFSMVMKEDCPSSARRRADSLVSVYQGSTEWETGEYDYIASSVKPVK